MRAWVFRIETQRAYHEVEGAGIDAAGKAEGATIFNLLERRKRRMIKCYGSAGIQMPPQRYAEETAAAQTVGFQTDKLRHGTGLGGERKSRQRSGE